MERRKHKVFISYHHEYDQLAKEALLALNDQYQIFIDGSVCIGDIDEHATDEFIRETIRDDYLKDTTVTILLVGLETKNRKHIDWELYSSMYDGKKNKKSGILVVQLPSTNPNYFTAAHGSREKEFIYSSTVDWCNISSREEYNKRYPYLPDRIIDNLLNDKVKISVVKWDDIENNPRNLSLLIELTFQDKDSCEYDMSRNMRKYNS